MTRDPPQVMNQSIVGRAPWSCLRTASEARSPVSGAGSPRAASRGVRIWRAWGRQRCLHSPVPYDPGHNPFAFYGGQCQRKLCPSPSSRRPRARHTRLHNAGDGDPLSPESISRPAGGQAILAAMASVPGRARVNDRRHGLLQRRNRVFFKGSMCSPSCTLILAGCWRRRARPNRMQPV